MCSLYTYLYVPVAKSAMDATTNEHAQHDLVVGGKVMKVHMSRTASTFLEGREGFFLLILYLDPADRWFRVCMF